MAHSVPDTSNPGYWMPFEAAKAISATFCWHIRHALTPLFGTDFPALCVPPDDRARYGRMVIDPAIVKKATETANHFRSLELKERPASALPLSYGPSITPGLLRVDALNQPPSGIDAKVKFRRILYADSECGSASELSDRYCISPLSPPRSSFTPVNGPRSSDRIPRSQMRSPQEIFTSLSRTSPKPASPSISEEESETDVSSSNLYSDLSCTPTESLSPHDEMDVDCDEEVHGIDADDHSEFADEAKGEEYSDPHDKDNPSDERKCDADRSSSTHAPQSKRSLSRTAITCSRPRVQPSLFAREVEVAHTLLRLHMQEATASDVDVDDDADDAIPGPLLGARSAGSAPGSRKRRRNSV